MTFAEAETRLRNQYLNESSTTGHFTSSLVTTLVADAARDLGSLLQVPRYNEVRSLTNTVGLQGRFPMSNPVPSTVFKVVVDNRLLREVGDGEIDSYVDDSGSPAVWNYEHANGVLAIAPMPYQAHRVRIHFYVDGQFASQPWSNRHTQYHHLIVDQAAVYAFQSSQEPELEQQAAVMLKNKLELLPDWIRPKHLGGKSDS